MILEHVVLPVDPSRAADFEEAFDQAQPLIRASPGFVRLSLSRSIERPEHYLLLVEWATLEDHTVGFRGSPGYARWAQLLHGFYDPFPEVEHYVAVV